MHALIISMSFLRFSLLRLRVYLLSMSLPFPPPGSFSPPPRPIPEWARRVCAGGSSSGLSASLRLLFAQCWRERPARTALSRIKQVVRLSHNFIVHLSPTEEHGASRNQQVSPGQRGDQHRGCRRATPSLQLLTIRTETAQNRNLYFFSF